MLYLVERYDTDKYRKTLWHIPIGLYKNKGNAAIRVCEDS